MGKKKKRSRVSEDEEIESDTNPFDKNENSLYQVLGVEKTASQQEIKKAYYKLALRLHPDKNPGDEEAKAKFQQLQNVIAILGDEEKRAVYDQTGCVDDAELAGDVVQNLKEYFRAMYKKVTEADIEEFEANYRGSDIEKNDLIDLYKKCHGNMNRSSKKQPEKELYAIISQRKHERKDHFDSMFSSLISKYGGGQMPEPSEEEFEAAQRKVESGRSSKKLKRK
ncbi:hypothetical protein JHK82_027452 [Glycine max]|nr:hypothetical protein JHK82_027452 [Glycine max]